MSIHIVHIGISYDGISFDGHADTHGEQSHQIVIYILTNCKHIMIIAGQTRYFI